MPRKRRSYQTKTNGGRRQGSPSPSPFVTRRRGRSRPSPSPIPSSTSPSPFSRVQLKPTPHRSNPWKRTPRSTTESKKRRNSELETPINLSKVDVGKYRTGVSTRSKQLLMAARGERDSSQKPSEKKRLINSIRGYHPSSIEESAEKTITITGTVTKTPIHKSRFLQRLASKTPVSSSAREIIETPATPGIPSMTTPMLKPSLLSRYQTPMSHIRKPLSFTTPASTVSRSFANADTVPNTNPRHGGIHFKFDDNSPIKAHKQLTNKAQSHSSSSTSSSTDIVKTPAPFKVKSIKKTTPKSTPSTIDRLERNLNRSLHISKIELSAKKEVRKKVSYDSENEDDTPVAKVTKPNFESKTKKLDSKDAGKSKAKKYNVRLLLPTKYHLLMKKHHALETTLAMYVGRQHFYVLYTEIKSSIERICRRKFTKCDLRQMAYLMPEYYDIGWKIVFNRTSKGREWRLTVAAKNGSTDDKGNKRFLTSGAIQDRQVMFRQKLVDFVVEQHEKWIEKNEMVEFDPYERGHWHRGFDLENVREIPFGDIPERPSGKETQMEKLKRDIEVRKQEKSALIHKFMKQTQEKESGATAKTLSRVKDTSIEASVSPVNIPKHLSHLNTKILDKVRAKSKANKVIKRKQEEVYLSKKVGDINASSKKSKRLESDGNVKELRYRYEQLHYLMNLIRTTYIANKKTCLPYERLVSLLHKAHKNHANININEIDRQVTLLTGMKKSLLNIRKGRTMKIARINSSVDMNALKQEINHQIELL